MGQVDLPGFFTDGLGSIPSQLVSLLWLESNTQTPLKAEIGDQALAGIKKSLSQSLSKSLLMLAMCQNLQCSLIVAMILVCF